MIFILWIRWDPFTVGSDRQGDQGPVYRLLGNSAGMHPALGAPYPDCNRASCWDLPINTVHIQEEGM
jgi:hypothetical protein